MVENNGIKDKIFGLFYPLSTIEWSTLHLSNENIRKLQNNFPWSLTAS